MKNEQVISELLCLSRNLEKIRQLSQRKGELLVKARGKFNPSMVFELKQFIRTLKANEVPITVVTSGPEFCLQLELEQLGLLEAVDIVVYTEDVARSRPDSEPYCVASSQIKHPLELYIVIASSNLSIDGSFDVGCKSIAIANHGPTYKVASADLMVKSLDMLSFVNFKQLFGQKGGREPLSSQFEEEPDDDESIYPLTEVALEL